MKFILFILYIVMWTIGELGTIVNLTGGNMPLFWASLLLWAASVIFAIKVQAAFP